MLGVIRCVGGAEGVEAEDELDDREADLLDVSFCGTKNRLIWKTYHHIIPREPLKPTLRNHSSTDQRSNSRSQPVRTMQNAHQLISISHSSNPCIPSSILESISKSDKHEDHWDDWVGWCYTGDGVSDDLTNRCRHSDAELPELDVDPVDEDGGECVTGERGEEHTGDDCVRNIVVCFKLRHVSIKL